MRFAARDPRMNRADRYGVGAVAGRVFHESLERRKIAEALRRAAVQRVELNGHTPKAMVEASRKISLWPFRWRFGLPDRCDPAAAVANGGSVVRIVSERGEDKAKCIRRDALLLAERIGPLHRQAGCMGQCEELTFAHACSNQTMVENAGIRLPSVLPQIGALVGIF